MNLSRPHALACLVGAALCLASALFAQPSGGPYGPVHQRYELPDSGRIYFVAPDGAADSPGESLERPTTLESAIARVVTGDAIVLRGGVYRTGGLRLSQGITMQPYADERPILKGTEIADSWEALPSGAWRTPWKRLFPAQPADWWRSDRNIDRTPLHLFNNDMVFLDGKSLAAVGSLDELSAGEHYIDYEEGIVYIGDDPAGRAVEITARNSALVRTMRAAHGKPNDGKGPAIRGIVFTQYARLALEIEGIEPGAFMDPSRFGKEIVGATLEHLAITHCSRVAGYFRGDGLVIRNCLVADTGTEGLYVINSSDVLLEKNIVTRTNNAEQLTGYYASAVKIFNQTHRVVCRDNLIIDNPHASGIWYDVGNVDGAIVDNWFENTNDGIFFEISKGVVCAGNVFVDCEPGVRILNSSNARIYQNTFFNSPASFERNERSSEAGDHFGWHASSGPEVDARHGHEFVNNLLASDAPFEGPLLRFYQPIEMRDQLAEPQVAALDGNVYVRLAGAAPQPLIAWSPAQGESGYADLSTLDDLRELYPQFERAGRYFPDHAGPLFRSAPLGRFELERAFAASDAGAPLPADIREALSRAARDETFPGAYKPQ